MTDLEQAQSILRFYTEKRIQLECQMKGETFDPDRFEQSFQIMLATEDGERIIAKMAKSVKDTTE
jgi:hypothetical protein